MLLLCNLINVQYGVLKVNNECWGEISEVAWSTVSLNVNFL